MPSHQTPNNGNIPKVILTNLAGEPVDPSGGGGAAATDVLSQVYCRTLAVSEMATLPGRPTLPNLLTSLAISVTAASTAGVTVNSTAGTGGGTLTLSPGQSVSISDNGAEFNTPVIYVLQGATAQFACTMKEVA